MKRRTVLRSAGVAAMAGLAGCIEGIQSHFEGSVQGVIPMRITNEGDRPQNIRLEAYAIESDRQTYDESYSVTAKEFVQPPHLEKTEQRFRVIRFEGQESSSVDTARISPDVKLVSITVYEQDVEIELVFNEEEAENVSADSDGNETEPAADEDPDATDGN